MITGAAIFVAGLILGIALTFAGAWVYEKLAFPDPPPPVKDVGPPKATCACGDLRSMHIDGKGKCQAPARHSYDSKTLCACQLYDGPEPLMTVHYTQDIENR